MTYYDSAKQTPAYVDGATSRQTAGVANNSLTVPASATDPRLVLVSAFSNVETDTIAPPAGWSTLIDDGSATDRVCLFGKICSAETIGGSWTWVKTGVGGAWRVQSAVCQNAAMPTQWDMQRWASVTPPNHSMPASNQGTGLVYFHDQETASPAINTNGNPTTTAGSGSIQISLEQSNTGASPAGFVFSARPGGNVSGIESGAPWLKGIAFTLAGVSTNNAAAAAGIAILIPPA